MAGSLGGSHALSVMLWGRVRSALASQYGLLLLMARTTRRAMQVQCSWAIAIPPADHASLASPVAPLLAGIPPPPSHRPARLPARRLDSVESVGNLLHDAHLVLVTPIPAIRIPLLSAPPLYPLTNQQPGRHPGHQDSSFVPNGPLVQYTAAQGAR